MRLTYKNMTVFKPINQVPSRSTFSNTINSSKITFVIIEVRINPITVFINKFKPFYQIKVIIIIEINFSIKIYIFSYNYNTIFSFKLNSTIILSRFINTKFLFFSNRFYNDRNRIFINIINTANRYSIWSYPK